MQEQHLYEYAVIRWVPQVERDEFINIGVMLFCKRAKTLDMVYHLDDVRLAAFHPLFDLVELKAHLVALENICRGQLSGGPISQLDMASRFRWLTAMRSTTIQTSRVHPGLCYHPADTLDKLFRQLVLLP
jgi:hypothetical protein